jgi:hypothetical protein
VTAGHFESAALRLAIGQLEALASDLAGRGFDTNLTHDGRTTGLSVVNQAIPGHRENIAARPDKNGTWWFWWSWGDRITRITDIEAAAFKIAYVLTPHAGG